MVRASYEGDATASLSDEVLGSLLRGDISVARDAGEQFGQTGACEEHQRDAHLVDALEVFVVGSILRQAGDDTSHMQVDEVVDGRLFLLVALVRVAADDGVAILPCPLLDAVEHAGKVVGHQVGHHNAYHPWCFLPQAAREGVGAVVQLLGQLLDTLFHLVAHLVRIAQGSRYGSDADT